MPVSSSKPTFIFHNIPLQLVMVLAFVVQAMVIMGLTGYLSHSHWSIWAYGLPIMLSIGFGTIGANWISQRYQSLAQVEFAIKESQEKYKVLFQTLPIGISITDKESHIIESNAIAEHWLGTPETRKISRHPQPEINPKIILSDGTPMPVEEYPCVRALRNNQAIYNEEMGVICSDGILRWFSVNASPIPLENYGVVLVHVNISDRKLAEQAMRLSESRLQTFINNAPTPISIKDLEGKYLSINSEFAYWMQVPAEGILGRLDYELFPADNVKTSRTHELQVIFEGISVTFEDTIPLPDGRHTFLITKFPLMDERNSPYAIAGIYLDISDRKQAELALAEVEANLRRANEELQKLVNLDGLTQIANRRCFDEKIVYEWQRLYRDRQPLSLLMFDVDYFKLYNDHYGHQLGDQCLLMIAQAVDQLVCRSADLVARYGGEEFIVILPNTNLEGAIAVGKNLHKAIADLQIPHEYSDVSDIITVSMGIASDIPKLDLSPYVIINQADQALYYAKQQGRNRSVIFTD
jgi:diguanylate cyclase (GGDEF)-like protein/PAS domain S-box-containing protein